MELLDPDLLAELSRLNRLHGLGVPGPPLESRRGAGGWPELEILYRVRLDHASTEELALEFRLDDPGEAERLAALAAEYLRSRGVPL